MKLLGPTTMALGTAEGSFPNSIPDPYYPVGVIAGTVTDNDNEDTIPGIDDGLVTLESTKVNNMTDFITVESSHWMLRYNEEVAVQAVAFLHNAKFKKDKKI